MRTTLTLEPDVAALLQRVRRTQGGSFKTVVNNALREGLRHMIVPPARRFDIELLPLTSVNV
jgi:hypothetical protein